MANTDSYYRQTELADALENAIDDLQDAQETIINATTEFHKTVKLQGDQSISGIKRFESTPYTATPDSSANDERAANTAWVSTKVSSAVVQAKQDINSTLLEMRSDVTDEITQKVSQAMGSVDTSHATTATKLENSIDLKIEDYKHNTISTQSFDGSKNVTFTLPQSLNADVNYAAKAGHATEADSIAGVSLQIHDAENIIASDENANRNALYVDPQNGNDSNLGTANSRLKTLKMALYRSRKYNGTVNIYLARGTYDDGDFHVHTGTRVEIYLEGDVYIKGLITWKDCLVYIHLQGHNFESNNSIKVWMYGSLVFDNNTELRPYIYVFGLNVSDFSRLKFEGNIDIYSHYPDQSIWEAALTYEYSTLELATGAALYLTSYEKNPSFNGINGGLKIYRHGLVTLQSSCVLMAQQIAIYDHSSLLTHGNIKAGAISAYESSIFSHDTNAITIYPLTSVCLHIEWNSMCKIDSGALNIVGKIKYSGDSSYTEYSTDWGFCIHTNSSMYLKCAINFTDITFNEAPVRAMIGSDIEINNATTITSTNVTSTKKYVVRECSVMTSSGKVFPGTATGTVDSSSFYS